MEGEKKRKRKNNSNVKKQKAHSTGCGGRLRMGCEESPIEFNERIGKGQEKMEGGSKSKETRIPMPMMGTEMHRWPSWSLVSLILLLFRPISKCRKLIIVKSVIDREALISAVAFRRFVESAI
jgi:hypothetical protein